MEKKRQYNYVETTLWGCNMGHYFILDFGFDCPECSEELKNPKDFQIPDIYRNIVGMSYDEILRRVKNNVQDGLYNQSNPNETPDMELSQTKTLGSVKTFSGIDDNSADDETVSTNDEEKIIVTKLDEVVVLDENIHRYKHVRCPNNHRFPMSHGRCSYCGAFGIYKDVRSEPATHVPAMIDNENGPKELETHGLILCANGHVYSKYKESCDTCGTRRKATDSPPPQNQSPEEDTHFNPFRCPVYEFTASGWSSYGSKNQSKKCERRDEGNGN